MHYAMHNSLQINGNIAVFSHCLLILVLYYANRTVVSYNNYNLTLFLLFLQAKSEVSLMGSQTSITSTQSAPPGGCKTDDTISISSTTSTKGYYYKKNKCKDQADTVSLSSAKSGR